jgi:hypothetical protein
MHLKACHVQAFYFVIPFRAVKVAHNWFIDREI